MRGRLEMLVFGPTVGRLSQQMFHLLPHRCGDGGGIEFGDGQVGFAQQHRRTDVAQRGDLHVLARSYFAQRGQGAPRHQVIADENAVGARPVAAKNGARRLVTLLGQRGLIARRHVEPAFVVLHQPGQKRHLPFA